MLCNWIVNGNTNNWIYKIFYSHLLLYCVMENWERNKSKHFHTLDFYWGYPYLCVQFFKTLNYVYVYKPLLTWLFTFFIHRSLFGRDVRQVTNYISLTHKLLDIQNHSLYHWHHKLDYHRNIYLYNTFYLNMDHHKPLL